MSAGSRVFLVVGPSRAGKTSLIQAYTGWRGLCLENLPPTVGIDLDAGKGYISHDDLQLNAGQDEIAAKLASLIPAYGLELEIWEIGGREPDREAPRGRPFDGLLICYDSTDRSSFFKATHVLVRKMMDWHMSHARNQGATAKPQRRMAVVLCGTKADGKVVVKTEEVEDFVRENGVHSAMLTSARTGEGVGAVFRNLALAVLESELGHVADKEVAVERSRCLAEQSWGLPRNVGVPTSPMTSPRGVRPFEPPRGTQQAEPLVEVLDRNASGAVCAPRTLARCLERGLLHRAVHVWLLVPRQGALLLRRYALDAMKHPGSWGPTVHGEVRCYGAGGDGHAAELSAQTAARSLLEQTGVETHQVEELDHWFSCEVHEGACHELLDVYVAAIKGEGLPPLRLHAAEEVDWVYYVDLFSLEAAEAGTIFHMHEEYRQSMLRRLRYNIVQEDAVAAFGRRDGFCGKIAAHHRGPCPPTRPIIATS